MGTNEVGRQSSPDSDGNRLRQPAALSSVEGHDGAWDEAAWTNADGAPMLPRLRYLAFNDPTKAQREAWLTLAFADVDQFSYSDGATSYLSLAARGFDGLLVGGNDVQRMTRIVRRGGAMLARRMKVALVYGANSQRRAQLISAGFDDVFDAEKTHPMEARARAVAIWRRYLMRFNQERVELQNETLLSRICNPYKLSTREKKVLLLLLKSDHHFVTYAALKREVSDYHEEVSDKYLKVIVCLLRRKLIPGASIVSRTLKGYSLHF